MTKKGLIAKISMRLLKLEFKSDNIIKPKAMKYIVEKNIARLGVKSSYFTLYKSNGKSQYRIESIARKILQTKILLSEELNKID